MAALSGGYIVYDNVKFRLKSWRNKKIHLCDVLAAGLIDFNQRSRQLSIHGKRNHHFMKYFNIHNKYFWESLHALQLTELRKLPATRTM